MPSRFQPILETYYCTAFLVYSASSRPFFWELGSLLLVRNWRFRFAGHLDSDGQESQVCRPDPGSDRKLVCPSGDLHTTQRDLIEAQQTDCQRYAEYRYHLNKGVNHRSSNNLKTGISQVR